MDSPILDEGTGRTFTKLIKNSVIAVTIDDLNEGLIVVSFSHEDNLYQGVLLQLNRERGIPSGISFPKDYCTGSVVEPLGENDPTQIPPLPQRHTYFQDRDGSLSDPTGLKSRLALRRVIKPPARFKNSRMSLRLRSRPILCAKCRTLCEDKVSSQSSDASEDTEVSKKIITTPGGVTTRRGKSTVGVTLVPNLSSLESESTQDYSYVSVGSKSFIENYWKRPSLMPQLDEKIGRITPSTSSFSSGQGGPYKPPISESVVVKPVPKIPKISSSWINENKLTLTLTKDNNNKVLPKLLVSSNPCSDKTVKIKKSKNFKTYKTKLVNNFCNPDEVNDRSLEFPDLKEIPEEGLGDPSIPSQLLDSNLDPGEVGLRDDINVNSKMWENRIRKKSTVPARFRDEGYLTKNIFNFKRRRVEEEGLEDGESPEHLNRLTPFEDMDQELSEKELNKLSPPETSSSSDSSRTTSAGTPLPNLPVMVSSVSGTNGHADIKIEPAKTPVIKISFGTPGNGVVVEIPPKAKQEDAGLPIDKAARKAMKKAKKEARRKLSLSREPSPSAKHVLPQTPSPPASVSADYPLVSESVEPDPGIGDIKLPDTEPYYVSKKKKKEKKKKRNKVKDACDSTVSQGNYTSPPHEDSSENYEGISSPTPDQSACNRNLDVDIPVDTTEDIPTVDDGNSTEINNLDSQTGCSTVNPKETPQRLCISLKRLHDNSIASWDITQSCITCSHNELESGEPEQVGSPTSSEPNDYPMNDSPSNEQRNVNASSIESYTDESRNYIYKKGDIIWGKLPGCPWWPGKILDILFVDVDDVTARVSWYRASTLSCIRFSQLGPFAEQFETRYTRSRKRGSYQHAVRDALIEAHQLDPNDLPSD